MASGKKNYFRHYFNAGRDDKIVELIANHGKQAYFHYFRLIELCAEKESENPSDKYIFHRRTLCAELLVTNSKLGHHLLAMQSSLLLQYVMDDRKVEVLLPKLLKYMGRYQNKNTSNSPNKRKENKRKENKVEKKVIIKNEDIERVVSFLNEKAGTKFKSDSVATQKSLTKLFVKFSAEEVEKVITSKSAEWLNDANMKKYLRPSTLFGNKFETYLEESNFISGHDQSFDYIKKLQEGMNDSGI